MDPYIVLSYFEDIELEQQEQPPRTAIHVGDLTHLWSTGAYRPGELETQSGAIQNVVAVSNDLTSIEFANGSLTVPTTASVQVFD